MYQGFGNSPLNYGDPLGLCIGPWDELSCGEFASSFNPFSGGFWSRSWSFGSGYAVGAGKMAIAPGVLTYNLTGSVLYDLTGSHKYRAHKEVARQLGDKIYWALNNEADDVFVAAMDHLGAPMRNATDSAMRGDYFAAGMGGGETVATAILFYEAAASSPVPSAPAPATVPLASAGAVPAVVSTPSVTFVPGGVSGLTLMQGRNAPDELTRTRKTVVESPEATGAIRGLPPTIRRGFQKALEKLVLGERGFNQHRLRGDRAGQWAIDIPGTGKGRGAGRIFYRQTDDVVEILELDLKHKYLTPKD